LTLNHIHNIMSKSWIIGFKRFFINIY
jgi:hypothetical protein